MPREGRRILIAWWSITLLSMALGSMTAYVGPLYWLSALLLGITGFATLLVQALRLSRSRSAAPAWGLFLLGIGALGLALYYAASSPRFFP